MRVENMLGHEFFHEQAHIEKRHELKRQILLVVIFTFILAVFYRLFCHSQEYEADRIAAQKCGKAAAFESLKMLQMREKKSGFFAGLFSLHPKTEKRIRQL